jgi:flavin-dependent dehydrogenase
LKKITIIGAGLAGLISSILLNRKGFQVTLIEKKTFPFHRVCGEYISNETEPFLKREGLYPQVFAPPIIDKLLLTSTKGKAASMQLDMGGFGISRYTYDHFLYNIAKKEGVQIVEGSQVHDVTFSDGMFTVQYGNEQITTSPLVLGTYGKRSKLDKALDREFTKKRSPFIGVKYHIKTDFPADTVALHNFEGGYCGISKVENDTYNLCYLGRKAELKAVGNIPEMEKEFLHKNPYLKEVFENSEFLFEKPEVINEISFEPKSLVENHVIMAGDTAGLITPLCGNGMAMAIHSAKVLSDTIIDHWENEIFDRFALEYDYIEAWEQRFKQRLWVGRKSQNLFGTNFTSSLAMNIIKHTPTLAKAIVRQTHGDYIQ